MKLVFHFREALIERDNTRRRHRLKTLANHKRYLKAIDANLRQANDLLPLIHVDDGWYL